MSNKNGPKNIEDLVFDFIYEESINDAIRRTAAASSKSIIMKIEKVKKAVREYANHIIDGIDKENNPELEISKKCFMQCIDSIFGAIEEYKNEKKVDCCFTFGNAQKLVNMTMKRLYIRYYGTSKANGFKYCFCPMDRRMRDKVASKYNNIFDKSVAYDPECAWSKMNVPGKDKDGIDNFWLFQKAVDDLLSDEKYKEYKNRLEMDYFLFTEEE